jgi:hypothetical protein
MINNPGNLGLRPAGEGSTPQQPAAPAASPAASAPASSNSPAATSSPVTVRPNANK